MTARRINRRTFLGSAAAGLAASAFARPATAQGARRVVVVGGGFAGATAARWLKRINPQIAVTLVEASRIFTACPFSNGVIAGLRDLKAQQFGYEGIAKDGVSIAFAEATAVDPQARAVTLSTGDR